ncbi:hypothetical protein [Pengzhenrongella sp.]|uniref:hypothetical protein n=1 Tax=Pengzhenrongella sp. TaxID=2888820 RepID=UPI002F941795
MSTQTQRLYMNPWRDVRERWSAPRRLDMGKACIRFRAAADLDLPLIAETIAGSGVERLIEMHEHVRTSTRGA